MMPFAAGMYASGGRLEAAAGAATAGRSGGVEHDVADLAGEALGAPVEAAVDDEPPADAGPEGGVEEVPRAAAGAKAVLAEGRGGGVVLDGDGNSEALRKGGGKGGAAEGGDVGRDHDDAPLGIDPHDPEREAVSEKEALEAVFQAVRLAVREHHCQRAVLLGHNAAFDLAVVNAACERCRIKRNPFHPFSTLDTVSLGAVAFGQTVLSRISEQAGLGWDEDQALSARYDAYMTARVFCSIVNRWQDEYQRLADEARRMQAEEKSAD